MSERYPVESILVLADALGVKDIGAMTEAWVHKVDSAWTVAVNGHTAPVSVEPDGCMVLNLAPFEFAVWFNGWLAGILTASGDGTFASGACANQQEFAEAIDRIVAQIAAKGERDGD